MNGNALVPLRLSGTAYGRGRIHGVALKDTISRLASHWETELEGQYQLSADEIIARFLDRTGFLPAIQSWTPHLLDEVRGIADGCGLDFETILAFQCVDEIWANSEPIVGEHCSTFGFRGDAAHPPMLAQTIDVESFRDGAQVVLLFENGRPENPCLVTTCAGVLGFNGINRHGVGVCCNAQLQLRHARSGLPVAFVMRGILQCDSTDAAATFLREVPHATGQHYLVGGPRQIRSFECSAGGVAELAVDAAGDVIWHTNHPLASTDVHPWYRDLLDAGDTYPFLDNSRARLESLKQKLQMAPGGSRIEQFQDILSCTDNPRHPICSSGADGEFYAEVGLRTFASTVMVLTDPPELRITLDPPSKALWHTVRFST